MSDSGITLTNVELSTLPFGAGDTGTFDPSSFVAVDYSDPSSPVITGANVIFDLPGVGTANFSILSSFTIDFNSLTDTYTVDATNVSGDSLKLQWQGTNPNSLTDASVNVPGLGESFNNLVDGHNMISPSAPCFAAGTLIRTPMGDVPVESLKIGDLVLTASGDMRPVKWMGHRDLDFRRDPDPRPAFPVRIAADAFGPNRPSQDLYLSSGHSVCVDLVGEVFIPAGYLINGATIARIEVDEISYWHVELDSHDILLANNLPAESYMAMGNRGFFEERRGLLPANLQGRERTHADFCRPVVLDGPVLAFARQRLQTRAEAIGWTRSFETDLHLLVDGEVRRPLSEGDTAVFLFPAGARDVCLKSNTFIPDLLGGGDPRPLGASLRGLVFLGGRGDVRLVDLDDERLQDGLYPGEAKSGAAWRWTKGELALSPDFWAGLSGPVALTVTHNNTARQWVRPPAAEPEAPPLEAACASFSRASRRLATSHH